MRRNVEFESLRDAIKHHLIPTQLESDATLDEEALPQPVYVAHLILSKSEYVLTLVPTNLGE